MKTKLLSLFIFLSTKVVAGITLPAVFSDGMVLQRHSNVTLWGWATPKETLTISPEWTSQVYTTVTPNSSRWEISIPTPKAGGPYHIKIKGYSEIQLSNILIGEVWLCSGQSNMEMAASWGIENGDQEVAKANYPTIRFFNVPKMTADLPQQLISGQWQSCTPETMKYTSAVAYFFAQRLQALMPDVPVGLIVSAWGGTPAEVWIPKESIASNAELQSAAAHLHPSEYGPHLPGRTYNAMIHPLVGYSLAGVLWYQGESNVGSQIYEKTLEALIQSWRQNWKSELPFYIVQIAPYGSGYSEFSSVIVRNAQRKAMSIPKTQLVVTSDISTTDDIHPKNKKDVGIRLANCALYYQYQLEKSLVNSPLYEACQFQKNKAIVSFKFADGLYFKDPTKPSQFELAGADGQFYKAKAKIKGNTIELVAPEVKQPTTVRFAWGNGEQAQLFNKAHLPASSFITE